MIDAPREPSIAEQIAAMAAMGHNEPCYYCGSPCNGLAADPSQWPVPLCHHDDPGRTKWHHEGCIQERLQRVERMEAVVKAARETVAAMRFASNIDAAVIRLSVANHLMSRLVALDAAAPDTETVTAAHPYPPQL